MTILAIPNVVILKAINIDIQTIRIHIHINHENVQSAFQDTTALM